MAAPAMQQPELDTTSIPGYVIFPEQNDHASQAGAAPRSQVHPLGKFTNDLYIEALLAQFYRRMCHVGYLV